MNFYLASTITALGAPSLYCLAVFLASVKRDWSRGPVLGAPVFLTVATALAHFALAETGSISLLALPCGWALALLPHYIFSYHIERPGFFGHKFTFQVLGVLFLGPPGVTAVLLSAFTFLRR